MNASKKSGFKNIVSPSKLNLTAVSGVEENIPPPISNPVLSPSNPATPPPANGSFKTEVKSSKNCFL
jgi:hypothetical protein